MSPDNENTTDEESTEVVAPSETMDVDLWSGLTDRQLAVQSLKIRGLSTRMIAALLNISQRMVMKEIQSIRAIHSSRGIALDPNVYVGEAAAVYDEVAVQAWKEFQAIDAAHPQRTQMKINCLNIVMNSTDRKTKLLVELGVLKKAKLQVEVTAKSAGSTLVESLSSVDKAELGRKLMEGLLKPLPAPQAPQEPADFEDSPVKE